MGIENFENKECFCAFVGTLGPLKDEIVTLMQTARSILEAVQAGYMMTNFSLEDEARKLLVQSTIEILDQIVAPIEAPLAILESKTKMWADCPPVQNLSTVFRKTKEFVVKPLDDLRFDLKQLEHESNKTSNINGGIARVLTLMDEFIDFMQEC